MDLLSACFIFASCAVCGAGFSQLCHEIICGTSQNSLRVVILLLLLTNFILRLSYFGMMVTGSELSFEMDSVLLILPEWVVLADLAVLAFLYRKIVTEFEPVSSDWFRSPNFLMATILLFLAASSAVSIIIINEWNPTSRNLLAIICYKAGFDVIEVLSQLSYVRQILFSDTIGMESAFDRSTRMFAGINTAISISYVTHAIAVGCLSPTISRNLQAGNSLSLWSLNHQELALAVTCALTELLSLVGILIVLSSPILLIKHSYIPISSSLSSSSSVSHTGSSQSGWAAKGKNTTAPDIFLTAEDTARTPLLCRAYDRLPLSPSLRPSVGTATSSLCDELITLACSSGGSMQVSTSDGIASSERGAFSAQSTPQSDDIFLRSPATRNPMRFSFNEENLRLHATRGTSAVSSIASEPSTANSTIFADVDKWLDGADVTPHSRTASSGGYESCNSDQATVNRQSQAVQSVKLEDSDALSESGESESTINSSDEEWRADVDPDHAQLINAEGTAANIDQWVDHYSPKASDTKNMTREDLSSKSSNSSNSYSSKSLQSQLSIQPPRSLNIPTGAATAVYTVITSPPVSVSTPRSTAETASLKPLLLTRALSTGESSSCSPRSTVSDTSSWNSAQFQQSNNALRARVRSSKGGGAGGGRGGEATGSNRLNTGGAGSTGTLTSMRSNSSSWTEGGTFRRALHTRPIPDIPEMHNERSTSPSDDCTPLGSNMLESNTPISKSKETFISIPDDVSLPVTDSKAVVDAHLPLEDAEFTPAGRANIHESRILSPIPETAREKPTTFPTDVSFSASTAASDSLTVASIIAPTAAPTVTATIATVASSIAVNTAAESEGDDGSSGDNFVEEDESQWIDPYSPRSTTSTTSSPSSSTISDRSSWNSETFRRANDALRSRTTSVKRGSLGQLSKGGSLRKPLNRILSSMSAEGSEDGSAAGDDTTWGSMLRKVHQHSLSSLGDASGSRISSLQSDFNNSTIRTDQSNEPSGVLSAQSSFDGSPSPNPTATSEIQHSEASPRPLPNLPQHSQNSLHPPQVGMNPFFPTRTLPSPPVGGSQQGSSSSSRRPPLSLPTDSDSRYSTIRSTVSFTIPESSNEEGEEGSNCASNPENPDIDLDLDLDPSPHAKGDSCAKERSESSGSSSSSVSDIGSDVGSDFNEDDGGGGASGGVTGGEGGTGGGEVRTEGSGDIGDEDQWLDVPVLSNRSQLDATSNCSSWSSRHADS